MDELFEVMYQRRLLFLAARCSCIFSPNIRTNNNKNCHKPSMMITRSRKIPPPTSDHNGRERFLKRLSNEEQPHRMR